MMGCFVCQLRRDKPEDVKKGSGKTLPGNIRYVRRKAMAEIVYQLSEYTAVPCRARIEWLGENDSALLNEHLLLAGQQPMKDRHFRKTYRKGIACYCLLWHDGLPVARGAVEPYSEQAWEAADIRTAVDYRGRGFATEILRFLTQYIITHGKIATCRTEEDNYAMQKAIAAVGYIA